MNDIGIYIHIPFCKSKCYYCDFNSYDNKNDLIDKYVESLKFEILNNVELLQNKIVKSIYIGGGTPSYINEKHIEDILVIIKQISNISDDAEITIEVNPGTCDIKKLEVYFKNGINRLSFGLQSTNDKILKDIGRIHSYKEFEEEYEKAKKVGFKNISIDLMIGLPNQTIEDNIYDLEKLIKLNPSHISVYSLHLEENTKMKVLVDTKFLSLPDDKIEREMYHNTINMLEKEGYLQYEISNFSKIGKESKHNMNYWKQGNYIGFGAGASSFVNSTRYTNETDICKYITYVQNQDTYGIRKDIEELDEEDTLKEYVILSLRLRDGINLEKFKNKFKIGFEEKYIENIQYLTEKKLIKYSNEGKNICLTDKGKDLANLVWQEFI